HNRVAVTMSTQAISLVALGRDAEAIPLYQAANERIAANLGPGHIDVASGQYNLGGMEMRRGNPAVARQHFDRALEIWEQALGPTHTRVAAAWFGLAWVEEEEDDLDAAQTAYERAVAIWEAHPDIEAGNFAAALNNLALLYARQGDPRRALTMLERSARVEADTHGREHPAYAQALGTTAKIHLMLGESQRAEALAREAAQQLRQTLGPTHAKLASVLETLAEALRRLDRAAEAEPLLNEVLAIAGDDPQFLGTRARLALVRIDRGDLTGATAALDAMPTGADARAEMSPGVRAAVDFATARLSTDPQQRQQLAGRAIAALEQAGTDAPVPVEEVQHWLETSHAPRP
ncbi:MAG: tetratricopeptide repeat protein, partial [Deltaproteobacteria bacterium]|nr:tetratricopeptide repeat protein [Deltaproteobacteria bacterium]